MSVQRKPRHVSILALPDMSTGTPINGLFETLAIGNSVLSDGRNDGDAHFQVEIVGVEPGIFPGFCGLPMQIHRGVAEVAQTDIVIAASMFLPENGWVHGRHPEIVDWLHRQHQAGADLCTACAGALLLAETGLLDGRATTTHWAFAETFRRNFPQVRLRLDELLIVDGARGEFVMSGAANSWQDLILFLIARHVSPRAAQTVGKFLLYQWNMPNQVPFMPFSPPLDHGDGAILEVQDRLGASERCAFTVEELAEQTGMARATFNRRFKQATGLSPVEYLQQLRAERAKELLEQTQETIEEIAWQVGYDEPAAFRRVFRRITRLSPSDYRRKFRLIHVEQVPSGSVL